MINIAPLDEFHINITNEPPNIPNIDINNLGSFRVIQGLQHEKASKTF